MTLRKPFKTWA